MPARVLVVGGGISGLAAGCALRDRGLDPLVLEGTDRTGGTVRTERAEGHVFETGPTGFLDREPATLERVARLGAADRLVRASDAAHNRWLWRRGRLWLVPTSPPRFFLSGLLSPLGRARIALEPLARPPPPGEEETVAEFGRRRIGEEAVRTLLDPMVSGIFGGDVDRLSMASAFPRMVKLEREHGSLVRAMIALARERKRAGKKGGGPAGPGGTLTTMPGGMSELIGVFTRSLGVFVRTGARVVGIEPTSTGWRAALEQGQTVEGDALLLAVPAPEQARLLDPLEPAASAVLRAIPYASISIILLGFPRADVRHPLDGFGFLVPRREGLRALGAILVSSIFEGRAPEGQVQIDVRIGGATDPTAVELPDDRLIDLSMEALSKAFGIDAAPVFRWISRHPTGIPQYEVGHGGRVATVEREVRRRRRLFLSGNALHGVGFNDCVREAEHVAERIAGELA